MKREGATHSRTIIAGILGLPVMFLGAWLMAGGNELGLLLILVGCLTTALALSILVSRRILRNFCGVQDLPLTPDYSKPPPKSAENTPPQNPDPPPHESTLEAISVVEVPKAWLDALRHGIHIPMWELNGMRQRGVQPKTITEAYVILKASGSQLSVAEVEDLFILHRHQVRNAFDLVHIVQANARDIPR